MMKDYTFSTLLQRSYCIFTTFCLHLLYYANQNPVVCQNIVYLCHHETYPAYHSGSWP